MMPSIIRHLATLALVLAVFLVGCSKSPEAKKAEHVAAGDKYFAEARYQEAVLEYRNVLQVDINDKRAVKQLALAYFALGELGQAYPFLTRARDNDSEDSEVLVKLARVQFLGGKADEARREVDALLEKNPNHIEALLLLADMVKDPEEIASTIQRLQELKSDPQVKSLEIFFALGSLYVRGRDLAKAEMSFKDAVANAPNSPQAHMALADFFVIKKDFSKAEEEYRTAAGLAPEASEARIRLVDFLILNRRTAEAKPLLHEAMAKDPEYLPVLYRLGEISLNEQNLDETSKLIAMILKKNAAEPEGLLLQGRVQLAKGENGQAVEVLTKAAKAQPGAQPHYYLGLAYLRAGDLEKARSQFKETLDLNPEYMEANLRLAELDMQAGLNRDAFSLAQKVAAKNPNHLEALIIMAETADDPAAITEALKCLNQVKDQLKAQGRFHLARGRLLLKSNDLAGAEAALKEAVARDPDIVSGHLVLADLFLRKKDFSQAEYEYKAAASLAPPGSIAGIALADYYLAVNKSDEAKRFLQETLEKAPDAAAVLQRLAGIALTEKNYDECRKLLEALFKLNPADPDGLMVRGQMHLAQGEAASAIKDFQEAVKAQPNAARALYFLGRAYHQAGDYAQARTALRDAVTKDLNLPEATLLLAELDIRANAHDLAIAPMVRFTQQYPDSYTAQKLLGLAYMGKGNAAGAEAAIRKAIAINPQDARSRFMLGTALERQGKNREARKNFEEAQAELPDAMEPFLALVDLDLKEKQVDAALALVKDRIAKTPQNPELQVLLGRIYRAANDNEQAEAAFKKAIEMDSNATEAYLQLSTIYLQSKKYDEALAKLDGAIKANPGNLQALMLTAMIQQQKGNSPKAQELYEQILAADPGFAPAANNLAYLYVQQGGNLDKALKLAQTAKEKAPDNASFADTLGWVLYKKGNYEWALKPLQESAAKVPEDAAVQYHLGMTQLKLGNSDQAKVSLERALELDPNFSGAEEARKALEEIASQ